ncbi:OmpP1/FadL family transporter [Pseudofulvibacter geojedonensis]|uniref:OmpP1/FadL family transporter n=1 Tax=Pseudofulvibacter geojedonensis TaxID=1123758 RepID=A0ABW3I5G0_9FLAO
MRKLLSFVLFFLVGSSLYAGGYRVSIQGQKQLAMGHTGVAVISSAESAFFNPAGLSYLDGKLNVSIGGSAIFSTVKFQNIGDSYEAETDSPLGTPLNLYASYKINDWLTAGIAVYTPYGSRVEWEKDWAGSHLVNNINLKAIFVQPTISLKVNDYLSVGGGPIWVNGSVEFNRNLNTGTTSVGTGGRSNVTIEKTGITAWGYNVGLMLKPTEKLNIGFNYRSKVIMEAEDGDADFENIAILPDGKFDAELPLPAEVTIGLSYKFCDKFLFAFDYNFAQWSEYEALVVEFDNAAGTSTNLRNYKDSSTYRFGLQYEAHKKFTVRGGIYFDESPVQDGYFAPETPRNDSVGYTAGLSYHVNDKLSIDASFLYLHFKEIDNSYDYIDNGNGTFSSFGGTYKSSVFAPGIGVSYKL